tara:strand:- start:384 stop:569 length:186 start_codon:yes stop_codon:yes gene_type:complete
VPASESGYSVNMKKLKKELEAYFNSFDKKKSLFNTQYIEEYFISDWFFINLDQKEKEKIYN